MYSMGQCQNASLTSGNFTSIVDFPLVQAGRKQLPKEGMPVPRITKNDNNANGDFIRKILSHQLF